VEVSDFEKPVCRQLDKRCKLLWCLVLVFSMDVFHHSVTAFEHSTMMYNESFAIPVRAIV